MNINNVRIGKFIFIKGPKYSLIQIFRLMHLKYNKNNLALHFSTIQLKPQNWSAFETPARHSKWNFYSKSNITQNEMSLKIECHSKLKVTHNWMSLKMECHSNWNVAQKSMSLKMECHSKWNVTHNGLSLKMK